MLTFTYHTDLNFTAIYDNTAHVLQSSIRFYFIVWNERHTEKQYVWDSDLCWSKLKTKFNYIDSVVEDLKRLLHP